MKQPPKLPVGIHYDVQPNAPRCFYRDRHGNRCQRTAHSFGAHVC